MANTLLCNLIISATLSLLCCTAPAKNEPENKAPKKTIPSFDEQFEVFKSLGYILNPGITKELIFKEIMDRDYTIKNPDSIFTADPYSRLYYYLGWNSDKKHDYTNQCIWYDLEFIDPSDEYIHFMERMGKISDGEMKFTDIRLFVDKDGYEWIRFKVNGVSKKWKLEKEGYVSDSYFNRFSRLTTEFKTKGRYTIYDDGGQQFVIDYATPEEQSDFILKTGLNREWLGEGGHFSEPED